MKIRNGFVSNSSSSSFIIKNGKHLYTIGQVQTSMECLIDFYNSWYGLHNSPEEISYDVFDVEFSGEDITIDETGSNSIPYELYDLIGYKYCTSAKRES